MTYLIENEVYPIDLLQRIFEDPKFYKQNGMYGTINSVGYYHSFERNSLVFMLPKVFMRDKDKTVFNCSKDELIDFVKGQSLKHNQEFYWIRQLSILFYNSLSEFKRRHSETIIIHEEQTFDLNTNLGSKEYSYLDLLLSFVNFYKKNKQYILYKRIEFISDQSKNPKWEKALRKTNPIFINSSIPLYTKLPNKKKSIDTEEELLCYFLSILNHFNKEHDLNIRIDKSNSLIEGDKFKRLCSSGTAKLKRIKYRYFSDTMKKIFSLCEFYFAQFDNSSVRRPREDFLAISNYNIIFEDMIDKLFSDELINLSTDGVSISKLKHHEDGKIVDHIYSYQSLIDTSNIYFIGDSKYYKPSNIAGNISRYKQFTYAKNVIQFNINLLNKNINPGFKIRYRDTFLTEGYNLTPNFFIYGYIDNVDNYDFHDIKIKDDPIGSFHFSDRLFDRDTLFVHQYRVNFLYVLKAYSTFNLGAIAEFRNEIQREFRDNFINFFNCSKRCNFEFYESDLTPNEYQNFVDTNFKLLNGKCFCTNDMRLVLAKHVDDDSISGLLNSFKRIELS